MIIEACFKLRDKRKELNYTIEEVVERTKLHPSVIRDIEDGNLSNANPTYLKGFIKIYASFLGVDLKGSLDELSAPTPKNIRKVFPPSHRQAKRENEYLPAKFKKVLFTGIGAIVGLVSLVIVSRAVVRKIHSPAKNPQKEGAKSMPQVSPKNRPAKVSASLTAKRDCFLRTKVDGKLFFEGVLKKGVVETWNADREIEFRISDGSSVYVEVDGNPLPPLTSRHKPIKSLKITSSGISVDK